MPLKVKRDFSFSDNYIMPVKGDFSFSDNSVSYTHLTLPTKVNV